MKIVNIWTFLEFMSMANAPTPWQRRMANTLPLGHRKLVNPPPYPGGGTLGDSLDTSIMETFSKDFLEVHGLRSRGFQLLLHELQQHCEQKFEKEV